MKRVALIGILIAGSVTISAAQEARGAHPLKPQLTSRLESLAAALDGVMGYTIIDLVSGERIDRLAAMPFPTASSIKLAILYELFRQSDEGILKLDAPLPWDPKRAVGGSGVLVELSNPTLSLRDYATLMIVLSDNTATNVVIDTLGMDRINTRMQALGVPEIRLRRRMMDLRAAQEGRENVATPAALARLLSHIHKGEGLTRASRDAILGILKKDKTSPMRRGIPAGVPVANKPGDLDAVRADAGIVYLPERPYVFVAMTSWLQGDGDGERSIEQASRLAYRYFDRLATGSEYGRQVR